MIKRQLPRTQILLPDEPLAILLVTKTQANIKYLRDINFRRLNRKYAMKTIRLAHLFSNILMNIQIQNEVIISWNFAVPLFPRQISDEKWNWWVASRIPHLIKSRSTISFDGWVTEENS